MEPFNGPGAIAEGGATVNTNLAELVALRTNDGRPLAIRDEEGRPVGTVTDARLLTAIREHQ